MSFTVAALYHFFAFPQFEAMRNGMKQYMQNLGIKGSLLITTEGMNGTIAGEDAAIKTYIAYLEDIAKSSITVKWSYCDFQPFQRAKVRLKKETISLGETVDLTQVGEYIDPKDWNDLIQQDDVIILDTRNDYETHLGSFKGAILPEIRHFKQLPDYIRTQLADAKDKPIASFCTGGIRCEKLTAWLKQEGYEKVYHLKGGILQYFEDVPEEESLWQGECFVFDERVAVNHKLAASNSAKLCPQCDHSLSADDQKHPDYVEGQSCPYCQTAPKFFSGSCKPI